MPKKSPKSRIPWNPRTVEMIPRIIGKKESDLLLTNMAQLIYDLACQFSEEESRASSTISNLLGQKSEVQDD